MTGSSHEYLLEYHRIGNTVKVSAVDPVTGVEACIVGPADAGREHLSRTAVRKLKYVLSKSTDGKSSSGVIV